MADGGAVYSGAWACDVHRNTKEKCLGADEKRDTISENALKHVYT